MKKIIDHLKHMWKDPINTIEEADARKKEVMPWLLGSIGAAVLFSGLSNVGPLGFLMIFGLVGIFGAMAFGFMLFVIHKAKAKFAALTCDSCGAMAKFENREDYVANVSYVVSETSDYNVHVPKPDDKGVIHEISAKGTGFATVTISLKCPGCGAVKTLEYRIQPFKCEASEKKVLAKDAAVVKARLESAVKDMMEKYDDKEQRKSIPYTIQSIYHPRYEERTKPQAGNSDAFPFVGGVKISYHRGVSEMVDGFFLENELNGTITEPGKAKK